MSNARQGWNAAQIASERPLPARKALAPVGVRTALPYPGDNSCSHCGYHMCNCANNPEPTCAPVDCNAPALCNCDKCWFASPVSREPALLTYDQAVAACRAGETIGHAQKNVFGGKNVLYTYHGGVFYFNNQPAISFGQENCPDESLKTLQFRVIP